MKGPITVSVPFMALKQMEFALGDMKRHLPRHLATAVNRVYKSCRKEAAKRVGQKINLGLHSSVKPFSKPFNRAKTLKKSIRHTGRATPDSPSITISLWAGHPFSLKYFQANAYQRKSKKVVKGSGVQVKYRKGSGWSRIPQAFIVDSSGGHVYKRDGVSRKMGKHLKGKSPADFFQETQTPEAIVRVARERLPIELTRRIRELTLQAQGKIKLKASRTRS